VSAGLELSQPAVSVKQLLIFSLSSNVTAEQQGAIMALTAAQHSDWLYSTISIENY